MTVSAIAGPTRRALSASAVSESARLRTACLRVRAALSTRSQHGGLVAWMRRVTGMLGSADARCCKGWTEAWKVRGAKRVVPADVNDLPGSGWTASLCDLSEIIGPHAVVPGLIGMPETKDGVAGVVGVSAPLGGAEKGTLKELSLSAGRRYLARHEQSRLP